MTNEPNTSPRALVRFEDAGFRAGGKDILLGLTWRLRAGENWLVLGENGAGKSTFMRLVRGDIWPAPGMGLREYCLDGTPRPSPVGFKERTALVSPELREEYLHRGWGLPVRDVAASGFGQGAYLNRALAPRQEAELSGWLDRLGISRLAKKSILEVSTGQAMRALLARALVNRPRFLFLDEWHAGLDQGWRKEVDAVLSEQAERGCQIICATHSRAAALSCLTHAVVLGGGRILRQGPLAEVCGRSSRPKGATALPLPAAPSSPAFEADWVIKLEGASVVLKGKAVLSDLDWTVGQGESWALLGENGSGKTTLIKLLLGDLRPVLGGRVYRFGKPGLASIWEIRRRVGHVSAELQAGHRYHQPALDAVASGLRGAVGLPGEPEPFEREQARAALKMVGCQDLAGQDVRALSHGQLKLVLLARALVGRPRVLLWDEPMEGLSASWRDRLRGIMGNLLEGGIQIILSTHRLEEAPAQVSKVAVLHDGRMVWQGNRSDWERRDQQTARLKGAN